MNEVYEKDIISVEISSAQVEKLASDINDAFTSVEIDLSDNSIDFEFDDDDSNISEMEITSSVRTK